MTLFFVCGSQLLFLSSGSLVSPPPLTLSLSPSVCVCLLSPVCFFNTAHFCRYQSPSRTRPCCLARAHLRARPSHAWRASAYSRRHCANVPGGGTEECLVWRSPASPAVAHGARMASVLSPQPQARHCAPRLDIVYACVRPLASGSTKDFCLCPNDQQQKRQQTRGECGGGGASQIPILIVLGKFRAVCGKWKIKKSTSASKNSTGGRRPKQTIKMVMCSG